MLMLLLLLCRLLWMGILVVGLVDAHMRRRSPETQTRQPLMAMYCLR